MDGTYTCLRCFTTLARQTVRRSPATRAFPTASRALSTTAKPPPRKIGTQTKRKTDVSTTPSHVSHRAIANAAAQTSSASVEPQESTSPGAQYNGIPEGTWGRVLRPDRLFHQFSQSPIAAIRQRAAYTRQNAYCPHPDHQQTRLPASPHDPESRKSKGGNQPPAHVQFECPDCGIPVYCSEQHWAADYENHLEICDTLRQINEDDHDMRSGRYFPEFNYPPPQMDEILVNMMNWDTYLYTREFEAINNERSMRQATRLLTYPLTVGSVLHELSPYSIRKGGRLTVEGLKSLTALRYTMHPPRMGDGPGVKGLRLKSPPVRIFILGARAESSLPRDVWIQLSHIFGRCSIHLVFIGPESMVGRDAEFPLPERTSENPFGAIVEDRISPQMKITTYVEYFHTLHEAQHFYPYDPYFDCFMLYHPGLGHPASSAEWEETLPQLLETKCPVICTGYTEWDMNRDWKWVMEKCAGEVDLLMEPGENKFRSLRWDLNDLDPQDTSCGNYGIWAFRGKRYEATHRDSIEEASA